MRKSKDKSADTFEGIDITLPEPAALDLRYFDAGHRELLRKQILRTKRQLQLDMLDGAAAHTEGVNRLFLVTVFELPWLQHLHRSNTGDLEYFVKSGLCVVGNDIHVSLGEHIRLHDIVLRLA